MRSWRRFLVTTDHRGEYVTSVIWIHPRLRQRDLAGVIEVVLGHQTVIRQYPSQGPISLVARFAGPGEKP